MTIDEINIAITKGCFINNGSAFDVSKNLEFLWHKYYQVKNGLFVKKWVCTEIRGKKEVEECERLLSELPNGVTYTRTDSIVYASKELSEKPKDTYSRGQEDYKTVFQIHVSALYSQSIVHQNNGSKIVFLDDFDKKTMQEAETFKTKVLSDHKKILILYFKNSEKQTDYSTTKITVTNFSISFYSPVVLFKDVHLKPLQTESQRLGVMLALIKYAEDTKNFSNRIFFIRRTQDYERQNDFIEVSIESIKPAVPFLNEW